MWRKAVHASCRGVVCSVGMPVKTNLYLKDMTATELLDVCNERQYKVSLTHVLNGHEQVLVDTCANRTDLSGSGRSSCRCCGRFSCRLSRSGGSGRRRGTTVQSKPGARVYALVYIYAACHMQHATHALATHCWQHIVGSTCEYTAQLDTKIMV